MNATYDRFTTDILSDIEHMIEIFPEMVQSTEGTMRCRNKIPPLYLALFNKNIPLATLLKLAKQHKKFNMKLTINLNCSPISFVDDINNNLDPNLVVPYYKNTLDSITD